MIAAHLINNVISVGVFDEIAFQKEEKTMGNVEERVKDIETMLLCLNAGWIKIEKCNLLSWFIAKVM